MSLGNAMTFIKNVEINKELRQACYKCHSKLELLSMLAQEELEFTQNEFDNAVTMLLVKCQTYEEADCVKQTEVWFSLFR